MLCDRTLKNTYRKFNRDYWNSELPDDVDVFFAPCPEDCVAFYTTQDDGTHMIQISPSIAGFRKFFKLILIHEMVHLALGKRERKLHGPTFQRELLRVLSMGAIKFV